MWINSGRFPIDFYLPHKKLSHICEKYRIPLVQSVREYPRLEYDAHQNKTGHQNMACDIADFLLNWGQFRTIVNG